MFTSLWILLCAFEHAMQSQPIYRGSRTLQLNVDAITKVSVTIDYDNDVVEISFIGHDIAWNGVGFGQHVMNGTYAIIMDYGEVDPIIDETILGHHTSGTRINDGVIVTISDETAGTTRTVFMVRPIDSDYYSFPPNPSAPTMEIPMIAAIGDSYGFFHYPGHTNVEPDQFTLTLDRIGTTTTEPTWSPTTEPVFTSTESLFTTTEEPLLTTSTEALPTVCCECVSTSEDSQMGWGEPCPKKEPGCSEDARCEDIICEYDPYCCTMEWDSRCSFQSQEVCSGNELPMCCGCTRKRNGYEPAGCETDGECEEVICSNDEFCCGDDRHGHGYWDHLCRKQAKAICKGYDMME